MGSERLWTIFKHSVVSSDVLGRSAAFLNVVMESELILKVPKRSEAFCNVVECSEGCFFEQFWKVPDGSEAFFDVQK